MAEAVKTFDFDIRPSTREVEGKLLPGGQDKVTFDVWNTSDRPLRAEVLIDPMKVPAGIEGAAVQPEDWAYWLKLVEPAEYDYKPGGKHTYTVRIHVGNLVTPGTYRFRLLVVGLDDPDHEYMGSLPVTFTVANPPTNSRPLLIGAIVLLALILIAIIAVINLLPPSPGLKGELLPPAEPVYAGSLAKYTLTLENRRPKTTAENVVLEYSYPDSVKGAWVEDPAAPAVARCGSTGTELRCALGNIDPLQSMTLNIYVLPGPLPVAPPPVLIAQSAVPKNRTPAPAPTNLLDSRGPGQFILHWVEDGTAQSAELPEEAITTEVKDPAGTAVVSGAAIPAVDVATVGQPVKITLIAWSNKLENDRVGLKYTLPPGMRFAQYPLYNQKKPQDPYCYEENANKRATDKYFTLICTGASLATFPIQVIPLQPSAGFVQELWGGAWKNEPKTGQTVSLELMKDDLKPMKLPAVNNQLVLNGVDDWLQLGYAKVPERFTVEMWVNPLSLEDGQTFIGAHHQNAEMTDVINTFMVGYYNGSISIDIMDDYHYLSQAKTTVPFHLAVAVEKNKDSGKPSVKAYINGELKGWNDPVDWKDRKPCNDLGPCEFATKIEMSPPAKSGASENKATPFHWVVGQDWDANGSGIAASDFFHGAISDVRIWDYPLNQEQVQADMYLPPPAYEITKAENDYKEKLKKKNQQLQKLPAETLLGWWPLAPASHAAANCVLANKGNIEQQAQAGQKDSPCLLADLSPNAFDGLRSGGEWVSAGPHYGNALAFDGRSVVSQPEVLLSSFVRVKDQQPAITRTSVPTPAKAPAPVPTSVNGGLVPVTISAWVYVDSVPSQRQMILSDVFFTGSGRKVIAGLMVDKNGHVAAMYNNVGAPRSATATPTQAAAVQATPAITRTLIPTMTPHVLIQTAQTAIAQTEEAQSRAAEQTQTAQAKIAQTQAAKANPTRTAIPTPNWLWSPTIVVKNSWSLIPEIKITIVVPSIEATAFAYVQAVQTQTAEVLREQTQTAQTQALQTQAAKRQAATQTAQARPTNTPIPQAHTVQLVMDGKPIPAGRWIHYAMVFWFDPTTGSLAWRNPTSGNIDLSNTEGTDPALMVIRDGRRIHGVLKNADPNEYGFMSEASIQRLKPGFTLGGLLQAPGDPLINPFIGRIDEVRVWNRALCPENIYSYLVPEIDLWQRLPGMTFDEYVYWPFDDDLGQGQNQAGDRSGLYRLPAHKEVFNLTVEGPSWVRNTTSIDYASEPAK